ncbi:MAG: NAD/NADP octopine/nopaline dehydrogenase family protein [Caldimonas sp.]
MKVAILGAGAGGAAAVAELSLAGHEVALWNRSLDTLAPFHALGGIAYEGVLGAGVAVPRLITGDIDTAIAGADVAVVALPTFSHVAVARALAAAGWRADRPIVLNPGHTGGALAFAHAYRGVRADVPPIAEFSTLTYVARKYRPDRVSVSGRAKRVRAAALPGGRAALDVACRLFPGAQPVADVLAADLANANLVLHPPGAVLGAAWVEATGGNFTFYVEAMTPGVARTMRRLDDERLAVAAAFGHELPNLIGEMKSIGTVEASVADTQDFAAAIAGGEANKRIKGPDSLQHRYYREDFGHGLLPFIELAAIAGVATPVAQSLLILAQAVVGTDYRDGGRTAQSMGIDGMSKAELIHFVRTP